MKKLLLLYLLTCSFFSYAQLKKDTPSTYQFIHPEKYFSFNPFGLIEREIIIGAGFGNRISKRSEYFAELSYLGRNPIYNAIVSLHGARSIFQYRYHLLNNRKPLINDKFHNGKRQAKISSFIGLEFRVKGYNFTDKDVIVNSVTNDTVNNFLYKANATIFGGAFITGATRNLSKNGKWKIETTVGLGLKVKTVTLKNIPADYKILKLSKTDLGAPEMFEETNLPYLPIAIRLKYCF